MIEIHLTISPHGLAPIDFGFFYNVTSKLTTCKLLLCSVFSKLRKMVCDAKLAFLNDKVEQSDHIV